MEIPAFFGKDGLTMTSANHVANLASEYARMLDSNFNNIDFVDTTISLIGEIPTEYTKGIDNEVLDTYPQILDDIAQAHALIAWLREAIKEKDKLMNSIPSSLMEYTRLKNITLYPISDKVNELKVLTESEYYASLPIKERNEYFALEAQASTLGKFIHPDGNYSKAMQDFTKKLHNVKHAEGTGRDMVIYSYSPSVELDNVNDMFFKLQDKYRSVQARLNGIKHQCEAAIEKSHIEYDNAVAEMNAEYNKQVNALTDEMKAYNHTKLAEIQELKIVIPDSLKPIYNKIVKLGKYEFNDLFI